MVWTAVFARGQSGSLEVHFFDIGQGKAIFIETPDGNQVLIDGGPDNSVLAKLSQAMPFYDRDIDLLILTHPDSDHLNGLVEVLKRYAVGKIIESGIIDSSAEYQAWHELIKEKNIPVVGALAGQKIKIGDDFVLEILYPNRSLSGQNFSNTNDSSIVSRLDYGQNSFLFTGDTEEKAENYLVGSGVNINADILDVSHHGSKNATGEEFLGAVSPDAAVIQVGASNRYGHPAPETLDRLEGIQVFRTDLCRDINIFSDGQKYNIESSCP
ncbi:MAG: hypothetical protein A2174_00615 [Candidatus Portnoybacteria bacterium RBG_13_41_18]|uniref:Metallo-beta-lactamase domain-containing protein n=1 Tax=Candidatus Portnoybacteria bacterium RBG_13_41_18 TaxID=1801991 RepID=A0A1G2F6C5_9BACT|nr:MAG: hypothetical protein A2174_00615 [Candidatus Portnoybacteria bacterium RBG_13_41_18]